MIRYHTGARVSASSSSLEAAILALTEVGAKKCILWQLAWNEGDLGITVTLDVRSICGGELALICHI